MSKPGFIAGFAGAGILSVLMKFLGYVVRFLSTIMLYFGLYVPFFLLLIRSDNSSDAGRRAFRLFDEFAVVPSGAFAVSCEFGDYFRKKHYSDAS